MPLLLSHIAHPHYEIEITGSDGSTGVESIVEIIRFVNVENHDMIPPVTRLYVKSFIPSYPIDRTI